MFNCRATSNFKPVTWLLKRFTIDTGVNTVNRKEHLYLRLLSKTELPRQP